MKYEKNLHKNVNKLENICSYNSNKLFKINGIQIDLKQWEKKSSRLNIFTPMLHQKPINNYIDSKIDPKINAENNMINSLNADIIHYRCDKLSKNSFKNKKSLKHALQNQKKAVEECQKNPLYHQFEAARKLKEKKLNELYNLKYFEKIRPQINYLKNDLFKRL